jgi:hypothetical protein
MLLATMLLMADAVANVPAVTTYLSLLVAMLLLLSLLLLEY